MEKTLNLIRFLGKWQEVSDFCRRTLRGNLYLIEREEKALEQKREECQLCQAVLGNPLGKERCLSSYTELFSPCVKDKEFFTFTCHLGLTGFSFPILVEKDQIATLVAGPILVEPKEDILKKTYGLGIEKRKVTENLKLLKCVSKDELSALSSMVKLAISPLASEIANQYETFQGIEEMRKREELLRVDELTGLHNRLYLVKRLEEEISRARRRKKPLSLIIFNLDQFRQVIDLHNSTIGDIITKETVSLLLGFKRKEDVLCRGEDNEFLLILTHTDQEQASFLAKRIQERINNYLFCQKEGLCLSLTISCGIAQLTEEISDDSHLIEMAERALFSIKSKGGGRRILFHSQIQDEAPKRCVITGIGLVTPIGLGKDAFWQALSAGKSGISRITQFDCSNMPVKIAGEVKDFNPEEFMGRKQAKRSDRATQLAIGASQLAIKDSGVNLEEERERMHVIIGSGAGGLAFGEEQVKAFLEKGPEKISPYLSIITFSAALSSMVSLELGIKGPSISISTGCPAGTDAIGYGFMAIRKGEAEIVLAGGAEAPLRPVLIHSFYAMRALSLRNDEPERASRPFDAKRDGFVIGEGAGMVILEELEHALKIGANIYAEVIGYASTNDAYHMTAPAPDGDSAAQCFRLALAEAGVRPADVDYINPHGSSTPLNDRAETMVIKKAFGEDAYKIPVSSTKSMLGHSIGATGAVEAIVCALAITANYIPPTINYEFPDPECDLDYVPNKGRQAKVDIAFTNSFGFGGKNSALVIKRYISDG